MSKVNLFEVLRHIDLGDYDYISTLPDAAKKKLPPYILLKWLAFTNDREKMLLLAASANQNIFKLYRYPEICYNLLCASGTNNAEFYKWRKPEVAPCKRPITVGILKAYYKISTKEAEDDSKLMNLESMRAIVDELGEWDQLDSLEKEYTDV